MEKADRLTVALVGADPLQAEALPECLERAGVPPGALLSFVDHPGAMELALDDSGAQVLLPLEREVVGQADAAFLFSGVPSVRETLSEWAATENFWLVDLTPDSKGPWRSPLEGGAALRAGGPVLAAPDPDAWCCASLLEALGPAARGPLVCHAFRPASRGGKAGVQELFQQSVGALSLKKVPEEVFGRTLAFNLYPEPDLARGAGAFSSCLCALSGREVQAPRAVMMAPLFHASVLSVLLEADAPASAAKSASAALKKRGFSSGRGSSFPTPLDKAGQETVRFRLTATDDGYLWAWFVYDELMAGKMALGAALLASLAGKSGGR